jgi:D-alanine--poly(phosphoribitol) ligase subunit 1
MNSISEIDRFGIEFPNEIAIICDENSLTYGELKRKSDALAYYIKNNFGDDKSPIAVYGHKNPYMIICFMACVKSGRAYIPLDISIPHNRVCDILNESDTKILLAVEDIYCENNKISFEDIQNITTQNDGKSVSSTCFVKEDEVYYIIFTSGSTGNPKGVQITHNCLINFLDWSLKFGETDKTSQIFINQAPFSFDLSVYELYMSLACRGTLFCLTKETQNNMKILFSKLKESYANIWVSTPSFADICLSDKSFNSKLMPLIEIFLFCGETLTNKTCTKLQEAFPSAIIINTYGPTESTVAVTDVIITRELNNTVSPLPIGKSKPGTNIIIVDKSRTPLPNGEKGEIMIVGDTVSIGYFKRPDLTQKVFTEYEIDGIKYPAYLTGDEGYLNDDMLFYCGRIDLQIKLHGYRIEIEDIENNLSKLDYVNSAIVVPVFKDGKVSYLAGFIILNNDIADNDFQAGLKIKNDVKHFIPEYMIPKKLIFKSSFPMTNNGKANRKALQGELL